MKHRLEEEELLRRLAALPRGIPPRSDPWAAISARIAASGDQTAGRRPWPAWWMAAAASFAAVVFAAALLLGPDRQQMPPNDSAVAGGEPAGDRNAALLPAALTASEMEYQAAFREFIDMGRARSNLSPHTLDSIDNGWAELRATENELAIALAINPTDRFLNDRMLELRARQLGFLQRLASLEQSNRRLTT